MKRLYYFIGAAALAAVTMTASPALNAQENGNRDENGRSPKNTAYHTGKLHYWTLPAPSGNPAKEKVWEIRATYTVPTSGKVNVYTVNSLQTDFTGFPATLADE